MRFDLLAGSLLAGWLAAVLVNWCADVLPGWRRPDQRPALAACTWLHCATLPWRLLRRGRCPRCGQPLARRSLAVELATPLLFAAFAFHLAGDPLHLAIAWLYVAFYVAVTVIDLETRRVLNVMLAPAAAAAVAISVLAAPPSPTSALLGGGVGFGLFFLLGVLGRGALGFGDVKLAGVIGLMTGWPGVLTALTAGALLGGVVALLLLLTGRATRKSKIAYAPYLAAGAVIALWGMLGGKIDELGWYAIIGFYANHQYVLRYLGADVFP
jgi:leader peptidase (prepilin peptidase)/N-methyltransferase